MVGEKMSREIKFRVILKVGTDTAKDDMAYYEHIEKTYFTLNESFLTSPFNINDWAEGEGYRIIKILAINRDTGLKDRNGDEIYDGDILKYYFTDGIPQPFVVKFGEYKEIIVINGGEYFEDVSGNGFYTERVGDINSFWYGKDEVEHLEIFGNIYENPELMDVIK